MLTPEHKQIIVGMVTVGGFAFVGKSVGAFKEMAIAWRYGITPIVDAYFFVFNLAQWPLVILSGVIPAVVIPALASNYQKKEEVVRFRSEILGGSLLLAFGVGALWRIVLPWFVQQRWVGLGGAQYHLATSIASWMAWIVPFGVVYVLLSSWTMAQRRHLNTLLDSVPAAAILLFVVFVPKGGITPLVAGSIVGFGAQLLFLALYLREEIPKPRLTFRSSLWRGVGTAFLFMLVGQTLQSSTRIVDQLFAAKIGSGEITVLGYTRKVIAIIDGLFGIAIGRSILPVLSQMRSQEAKLRKVAQKWVSLVFGIGVVITIVGIVGAQEVVRFLFQRGAFVSRDTVRVASALRFALLQLPFYFAAVVFRYTLFSLNRQDIYVLIAIVIVFSKLSSEWLFVSHLQWGLKGVFLSDILIYLSWIMGGVMFLLRRQKMAEGEKRR